MENNISNNGPPSAPAIDRKYVASLSSSSVALGQCLRSALASIEYNQEEEEQGPAKRIKLDSDATDCILRTLGESMTDTQLNQEDSTAPRVLLKGRLDHYNRVGQNWRIMIDNVEIQERPARLTERAKRRTAKPLWNPDEEKSATLPDKQEIQILAFNDL